MPDVAAAIRAKLDSMVEDPGKSYASCAGCEGDCWCQAWIDYQNALGAVLELHVPKRYDYLDAGDTPRSRIDCASCDSGGGWPQGWPCPTLHTVAKALRIEVADD